MSDIRDDLDEGMVYEKHGVGAGELDEQATVELMRRGAAEIDRLRTELQQHQWRSIGRSIESAPMDGTELLLCWWCDLNGWQYEVAPYSNLDVARRGEGYCHGRATHFAYLPKPPEPDQ